MCFNFRWYHWIFLRIVELICGFNPNQRNQGENFIINQWGCKIMTIWWQKKLQRYSLDGFKQAHSQDSDDNINYKVIPRMAGFKPAVKIYLNQTPCLPISSELMYAFNPNQLNQGDDVIINQWEWWSDDIPHDTLCLGTKFVTFRHQNWAICMFRSKRWAWFRLYDFD